ncbi:hypothetical protein C478_10923 [Natrinema thermotolerans DSM 11552]|nr:hypothetical protein C478_10923 [Natrinema thermotolerans DSM 11552]
MRVAADLAHQLRRDLERDVFSRQTLGLIGVAIVVAVFAFGQGEWSVAVLSLLLTGFFTYGPGRAIFCYFDSTGATITVGQSRRRSRSIRILVDAK